MNNRLGNLLVRNTITKEYLNKWKKKKNIIQIIN